VLAKHGVAASGVTSVPCASADQLAISSIFGLLHRDFTAWRICSLRCFGVMLAMRALPPSGAIFLRNRSDTSRFLPRPVRTARMDGLASRRGYRR
jgi:hypothetical protein